MVNLNEIAKKWQERWDTEKIFRVEEKPGEKKAYVLEMYPYPSSQGLHMGHARNYTIGDIFARFKRMQGYNVLYPMGYDSFGLPAENAAIKAKSHPKIFTEAAIKSFIRQQKELGLSYDWSRMIASHTPEYYRWDQWIFLKMLEKGLAYKKKAAVNWCPECNTVLANEQVHNGFCWRHTETRVDVKELSQWFFKITDYAEELLKGIDTLNWSEDVKIMQRNWIGRSEGTLIHFPIKGSDKTLTVFTTRPDTFFGITFLVYAPEHPDVMDLVKDTPYEPKVREFVRKVLIEDRFERTAEDKEKEGMFIGRYAINPVTKEEIPIYIANFVLYEYGTGAIIAVPAHDNRDFAFAKKYKLPIKVVINPDAYDIHPEKMVSAYVGDGTMVNSGEFNGERNRDAIDSITKHLEKKGFGKATVQYKLRDWLLSRQRFWGCPIPIIYCDKCGAVPVPEKDLPVLLPDDVEFGGKGNPLENSKSFISARCPKCHGPGKRETDTMDTFVDSSWYFLRYTDSKNKKAPFDSKKAACWMPIDLYIGGKEHACMHLIYFRFFTKFLRDLGMLKIDEPAPRLFNQGMLHKGGFVMSKSRGNVVTQEEIADRVGIDTARLFLVFVGSPDKDMEWDDKGIEGSFRFLNKVVSLFELKPVKPCSLSISKMHKTIKIVTERIESCEYNIAIIQIMQFVNFLSKRGASEESLGCLALLLAPFTPHLSEELWEILGKKPFISLAPWPKFESGKIDEEAEYLEDMVEVARDDIRRVLGLIGKEKPERIRFIVAAPWKYDFLRAAKALLEKTKDFSVIQKELMSGPLKVHGKEIAQMLPRYLKDMGKMPQMILSQEKELEALSGEDFGSPVIIEKEQDSKDQKARQSMPSKPAIVIE